MSSGRIDRIYGGFRHLQHLALFQALDGNRFPPPGRLPPVFLQQIAEIAPTLDQMTDCGVELLRGRPLTECMHLLRILVEIPYFADLNVLH